MRQIKFIRSGASSAFGAFAPGDLLRCGDEAAHHFVHDAQCAVYVDVPAVQTPATPQGGKPAATAKRKQQP